MVPKTGELHRFSFFLKGTHRYLCQSIKSVMTARVIELGSRASYTLRARSTPQHLSLGNVPDTCIFTPYLEVQISENIGNFCNTTYILYIDISDKMALDEDDFTIIKIYIHLN
jgi:hypothetical protein